MSATSSIPAAAGCRTLFISVPSASANRGESALANELQFRRSQHALWNAGASLATGDVLLFTSVDALLPPRWDDRVRAALSYGLASKAHDDLPSNCSRVSVSVPLGSFRLGFDPRSLVHGDSSALGSRLRLLAAASVVNGVRKLAQLHSISSTFLCAPQEGAWFVRRVDFTRLPLGPLPEGCCGGSSSPVTSLGDVDPVAAAVKGNTRDIAPSVVILGDGRGHDIKR